MDWAAELAEWIRTMYTEYRIVDVDPIIYACMQWFTEAWGGWLARNILAVSIVGHILAWLKIKAIRTPSVTDDRIVGYLQWLFGFGVAGKKNPPLSPFTKGGGAE